MSDLNENYPDARAVFTCRSIDYSGGLSDYKQQQLTVSQVRFAELDDETIQTYLAAALGEDEGRAVAVWLEDIPHVTLKRSPFFLELAVKQYLARGKQLVSDAAELLRGYVWLSVKREFDRDGKDRPLIGENDQRTPTQDENHGVNKSPSAWREGRLVGEEGIQYWRQLRKELQNDFKGTAKKRNITPATQESLKGDFLTWTEDGVEGWVLARHAAKVKRKPEYWDDSAFNSPVQPIVGICWCETQAYCRWHSAQSDALWRVLSEAGWEAAERSQGKGRPGSARDCAALYCARRSLC